MIALVVLALTSADCAGCHAAEAEAFATSRHASAAELAIFRASASHAKTAWCASCHQPATAGLACTTCHGDVAIRAARTPSAAALAAHPITVDPAFGTDRCAGCHQFATPLPDHLDPVVYSTQPLQSTVREAAGARCTGCHDPHAARGAHDPALVRAAIAIAARSTADGVEVRVTATGVGHRFPTGDPFRRLVIAVCEDAACTEVIATRAIGRSFALRDGVWAPVIDQTIADGETRIVRLAAGRFWRAELRYGDPRFEAGLPASEVALSLAGGPL